MMKTTGRPTWIMVALNMKHSPRIGKQMKFYRLPMLNISLCGKG
jgi:hypothetical protein